MPLISANPILTHLIYTDSHLDAYKLQRPPENVKPIPNYCDKFKNCKEKGSREPPGLFRSFFDLGEKCVVNIGHVRLLRAAAAVPLIRLR